MNKNKIMKASESQFHFFFGFALPPFLTFKIVILRVCLILFLMAVVGKSKT